MSIWASREAPSEDEHSDDCARWDKHGDSWEISERPCDCGQPDAPIVYQGSHVLPSENDPRGGWVDIASLSKFVRHYRDNPGSQDEPDGWEPFLRFGVNDSTVILTERNVRQIYETLGEWLEDISA